MQKRILVKQKTIDTAKIKNSFILYLKNKNVYYFQSVYCFVFNNNERFVVLVNDEKLIWKHWQKIFFQTRMSLNYKYLYF